MRKKQKQKWIKTGIASGILISSMIVFIVVLATLPGIPSTQCELVIDLGKEDVDDFTLEYARSENIADSHYHFVDLQSISNISSIGFNRVTIPEENLSQRVGHDLYCNGVPRVFYIESWSNNNEYCYMYRENGIWYIRDSPLSVITEVTLENMTTKLVQISS